MYVVIAALYYHPWISVTVIGVAITLIGVIITEARYGEVSPKLAKAERSASRDSSYPVLSGPGSGEEGRRT